MKAALLGVFSTPNSFVQECP